MSESRETGSIGPTSDQTDSEETGTIEDKMDNSREQVEIKEAGTIEDKKDSSSEQTDVKDDEARTEEVTVPSPKLRKINRRSSIAMAKRMSRASATYGLTLEEQLGMIPGPDEASNVDRFKQLLNLCVRNTCRLIEREEIDDGELEDEAKSVSNTLMNGCILDEERLRNITDRLVQTDLTVKPEDLLPCKVRAVREYTAKLDEEAAQWKKFLNERHQLYKLGESNYKSVVKGEIKVDSSQAFCLSADDKKFFRNLPNLSAALESVRKHEERQTLLAARLAAESKRLKGQLESVDEELKEAARQLVVDATEAQGVLKVNDIEDFLETGGSVLPTS